MRRALPWGSLGLGLLLVAGCGAGKDPVQRGNIDFNEAGSGGTDTGGSGDDGGLAGSGLGGEPSTGGTGGGDEPGGAGGLSTGGAVQGGAGALPGGAPTGGVSGGGDGGGGVAVTGGVPTAGAAGQGSGGYDVTIGVGFICTAHTDCRSGQICYNGLNVERRSCRVQCDPVDVGTQGDCLAGELCISRQGGGLAACLEVCEPFQSTSECSDGEYCYPSPDASYTGGEVVSGLCLAEGSGTSQSGESCESSDCASGLTCHQPLFDEIGHDHCGLSCDPAAIPGDPGACPTGQVCRESLVGDTACIELCDIGADDCPGATWCAPFHDWDLAPVIEGHCVAPGALGAGDDCTPGECAAGLVCAPLPPPFDADRSCRPICDPSGDPCADGAACVDLYNGDTGLGTCEAPCTLFETDTAAGCEAGEWCAPTHLGDGAGTCVSAGGAMAGDPCVFSADCAAGQFCDCRFGASGTCDVASRVCAAMCVPGATGTDPGACAAGQTCARLPIYGSASAFGVCREECDYDAGTPCTDTAETCVPGELLPDGVDACLDVPFEALSFGATCLTVGVDDGDPCGATALCVVPADPDALAICEDVCRVSAGAIGLSPHPDCEDPLQTCTEIESGLPYGRCL